MTTKTTTKTKTTLRSMSLIRNAVSNLALLGLSVSIGFFLTPFILGHLGGEHYGMWALASSLVGYFGLLELGMTTGVFRYVPLYRGQGDDARLNTTISTAVAFNATVGVVACLLAQLVANPVAVFFDGDLEFASLIRIIGLALALDLPSHAINAAVKGFEGFGAANVASAIGLVLRAGLLTGCVLLDYGLVAMGWSLFAVSCSSLLCQTIAFRRVCRNLQLSPRFVRWEQLKLLLTFGGVMLVASTANSLATELPKAIVGKLVSLEGITFLVIPMVLVGYYRQLVFTLTRVVAPRFSYLSAQAGGADMRRLFTCASRSIAIIAGGVALWFWVAGPVFLQLWTRKPEMVRAGPTLLVLATAALVLLSHRVCWDFMLAAGHQKQLALMEMVEGLAICALTIVFTKLWGIRGAALGIAVPLVLTRGVWQVMYVSKALDYGFLKYYGECILKPWALAGLLVGAAYLVGIHGWISNWPGLILISFLLLAGYALLAYLAAMGAEDRAYVDARLAFLGGRLRTEP